MSPAGKDITHSPGDPLHRGSCCCPFVVLACRPIPPAFLQPDSGFADTAHACPATARAQPLLLAQQRAQLGQSRSQRCLESGKGEGGLWEPSWKTWSCSRWILQGSSAVTHQHDFVRISQAQQPSKGDSKETTATLSDWQPAANAPCHFP